MKPSQSLEVVQIRSSVKGINQCSALARRLLETPSRGRPSQTRNMFQIFVSVKASGYLILCSHLGLCGHLGLCNNSGTPARQPSNCKLMFLDPRKEERPPPESRKVIQLAVSVKGISHL